MWKQIVAAGIGLAAFPASLAAQGLRYQFDYDEAEAEAAEPASAEPISAEQALERNNVVYGPPPPRRNCKEDPKNAEIVVCAEEEQDQSEFRVDSTADADPTSREALNDGVPRAPDVAGEGIFKGDGISFGSVPDPAVLIDFTLLPEAPEGSDADKISKGLKRAD